MRRPSQATVGKWAPIVAYGGTLNALVFLFLYAVGHTTGWGDNPYLQAAVGLVIGVISTLTAILVGNHVDVLINQKEQDHA